MQKITFENLPSTNTPISAQNLNLLQENVEDGIDEAGVVVSPTEPVTDRKKVWLQSNVKNMLNKRIINANVKSDGTLVEENTRLMFDYIEVKPNLTLTFSSNTTSGFLGIAFYDENKTFISRTYDNIKTSITATVPSTAKYARPFIQINGDTVLDENSINVYEMQLENGELRTTYEAVVEDKTYILNDNDVYEEFKPIDMTEWIPVANTVYYKKSGNVVTVRGYSANNKALDAGNYTTVATLPEEIRPGIQLGFPWTRIGENTVGITRINTTGVVELYSEGGTSYWAFTVTYII